MTGVVGGSASFETLLAADVAQLGMQVTPENVLQLHNVLRAEAKYIREQTRRLGFPIRIGKPGLDPVSEWAASDAGFNGKLDALHRQCQGYPKALDDAADQLAATAKGYGHTEEAVRDSFTAYYPRYLAMADTPAPAMPPPAGSPTALILQPYQPPPAGPARAPGDLRPTLTPPTTGQHGWRA